MTLMWLFRKKIQKNSYLIWRGVENFLQRDLEIFVIFLQLKEEMPLPDI